MAADPILFVAGQWLGAASGVLALATAAGFIARWGVRFRLVGVTSFTALLAISCLAFAVSYIPRITIEGAVTVPVVFDNGSNLVIAAAPDDLPQSAFAPTVQQLAQNIRTSGRIHGPNMPAARGRRKRATASRSSVLASRRVITPATSASL